MAESYFRRLKKKYNFSDTKKKNYQKMIATIIDENKKVAEKTIGKLTNKNYQEQMKKLKKGKTVKLPDLEKVFPKRNVRLIKSQESGKVIQETLRAKLEAGLRKVMSDFAEKGLPKMQIQRGKTTGRINPKMIEAFQKEAKSVYKTYT